MYFKDFPQITYQFEIGGKKKTTIVTDITRNVRFRKELFSNVAMYDEYIIRDGETPEIIAEKVYGNANLHWVIMLINERFDYLADFPLTQLQLTAYIKDKYTRPDRPENAPPVEYDIHHYENDDGYVVNGDAFNPLDPDFVPTAVTNIEYEERKNEEKRKIKLISPNLLNQVLAQYKDLM